MNKKLNDTIYQVIIYQAEFLKGKDNRAEKLGNKILIFWNGFIIMVALE